MNALYKHYNMNEFMLKMKPFYEKELSQKIKEPQFWYLLGNGSSFFGMSAYHWWLNSEHKDEAINAIEGHLSRMFK